MQTFQKTNDVITIKHLDRRTDSPYFTGSFRVRPGVQKHIHIQTT